MKKLSLTIGAVVSFLSVPVWLLLGLQALSSSELVLGFVLIFIGVPVSLAHAVVFDFVGEALKNKEAKIGDDKSANQTCISSDLRGTPWERNPGHTRK